MEPLRIGISPHSLPTQRSQAVQKGLSKGVSLWDFSLGRSDGCLLFAHMSAFIPTVQSKVVFAVVTSLPAERRWRGRWGGGACRLRVTSHRKCCLEHKISRKGEYRCSCSEQFRGIAVQQLSKCQPPSTGIENSSSPQAVARMEDGRAAVGAGWEGLLLC